MNKIYSDSVLYAYSVLENLIDQYDGTIMKKALGSIDDYSPAIVQCEAIIRLSYQKQLIIDLYLKVEEILKKFDESEMMHFEYKYFKRKPRSFFTGFDATSRKYFRKQVSLSKRFSDLLEKSGITDEVFEKDYLLIDFFKDLTERVKEKEEKSIKNTAKKKAA